MHEFADWPVLRAAEAEAEAAAEGGAIWPSLAVGFFVGGSRGRGSSAAGRCAPVAFARAVVRGGCAPGLAAPAVKMSWLAVPAGNGRGPHVARRRWIPAIPAPRFMCSEQTL